MNSLGYNVRAVMTTCFLQSSGAQLIKALRKLGFDVIRIKGSRSFPPTRRWAWHGSTVHRGETIGRGSCSNTARIATFT